MITAALLAAEFGVQDVFFALIALVALIGAARMVTTTNVVHAALDLLVVLAAVAALYIVLGAEFVAATQVLVYIGAILVLLLFGVMLTRSTIGHDPDLDYEQKWVGGLVSVALFAVMGYSLWDYYGDAALPAERVQSTEAVADSIFSTYIVAFEAISILLLAALIGAIVVARRD